MSFGVYSQFQTFGQSQELENILRNNCPTLEELLDRENFLFDLKAGALQAFTEYLCKYPENLEKMVYYVIITNEQMEDNEKSRKFPYIVSEIFALENSKLYDLLFMRHRNESLSSLSNERLTTIEDDILPEYQMHHEDQCKEEEDQAIAQISGTSSSNVYDIIVQCASFKSKSGMHLNENIRQQILTTLFRYLEVPQINDTSIGYYAKILKPLACKYGGEFWDHISQNTNIIGDLMQHINHYQIVEIVVQLLILDYKINDNIIINYRCYSFRKQVMDELIIQLDKQSDQINIVADVTQIFELLLDNGIQHKFYEPLRDLYDSLLKPLYFFKLAKKTNLQIVYQVFAKILILIQVNQSQDQKTADVIQIIQQIVQQIASNLTNQNNFGIRNLCLVQALDACDKFNNPLVFESMFQAQVYKSLIEYAINYQWNNQLQIYISSIFKSRIKDEKYCQRLIKDTDILTILKQYFFDQPYNLSYKQKCSYGFNCFLKTTSYTLLEKCKSNKKLNSSIYESNAQLMEEIAKLQKIEQTFLCDAEPKSHMQEAPPEISIDRQIEMLIDAQKQKEEQKQSHQEQQ